MGCLTGALNHIFELRSGQGRLLCDHIDLMNFTTSTELQSNFDTLSLFTVNVWSPRVSTALHKNLLGCLEIVESAKNGQESPNLRNATTFAICRMNRWRPPRDGDVHRQLPSAQQCDPEDQMTESLLISAIQYTILSLTGSFVCRSSRNYRISLSSRVASTP